MMKRIALLLVLSCSLGGFLAAEVEFLGLDLGKDDALLFTARASLPGGASCEALVAADLASGTMAQLTVYPEHIALVDSGRRLQIQNPFGLFRSDARLEMPAPVPGFPTFVRGSPIPSTRTLPSAASPDGAWILFAEPVSAAFARLILLDTGSGAVSPVAESVEFSVEEQPVRWSPDSERFVYAKANSLYYFSVEQLKGDRVLEESYRRIGEGGLGSARWGTEGSLFYLKGSSLYRILPAEFFTQALYRGLAGMGALVGKTPFPYDPNFDEFWVSLDGSRAILAKGGRSLFLVYLDPDDFGATARVVALPFLFLQGDTMVRDVLWPARGPATVFTGSLRGSERSAGIYRFAAPVDPAELDLAPAVRQLEATGALEIVLSPDETQVAIVTDSGVTVRSYEDWTVRNEINAAGALHVLWAGDGRLVVAGSRLIETVDLRKNTRSLVALSQVEAYGRGANGGILASVGGVPYSRSAPVFGKATAAPGTTAPATTAPAGVAVTQAIAPATAATAGTAASPAALPDAGGWFPAVGFKPIAPVTSTDNYRVYLDSLQSGAYRNQVMVRSARNFGTKSLFPAPSSPWAAFPEKDEVRSEGIFDHGSRIRRREMALVFDLVDDTAGLTKTLDVLRDAGVRSTFFVNGEFVRRNPGAARLLAGSGQELGSMFFTNVDPTDPRLRIDRDYVRRGLARAEDDWFGATGGELSLLWHTPYYAVNGDIIAAGATMSYAYIGRDVDPLDWVSKVDAWKLPGSYLPSHAIVERIVKAVKPGSIVPIRLGVSEGGRDDYLFNELSLLVDALRAAGYELVPVSTLMEHAR